MEYAAVPARIINLTSPQIYSVRDIALKLGRLMRKRVMFKGQPKGTDLLADASEAARLFGRPKMPLERGLELLAKSVMKREFPLNMPSKWEKRSGF
jgi:nucleoside-diphosphate-sugar epimerase